MTTITKNNTSKTNLILFTCIALSTSAIIAMENESHIVTVSNGLLKSPIAISSPIPYRSNGHANTPFQSDPTEIKPGQMGQFLLTPNNGISQFKLLLPYCYKKPFVDVTINKKEETIYIYSPDSSKEEISITINNTTEELTKRHASIDPALYQTAKILALQEKTARK